MTAMEDVKEVYDFYENGAEIGRLERGLGVVEFYRSKEIIAGYLSEQQNIVYDIGGGIGMYSKWLAEQGRQVTLIELAPAAVEYAKSRDKDLYAAEVGDARQLSQPDSSADAVLLMGPLYHLQKRKDRYAVLCEAYRVLKPGGLLFAAGISKFSSATWALSVYDEEHGFLNDDIYMDMILGEMRTGEHHRPEKYPNFIANAYFHTSDQLREEITGNGFEILGTHAVEGCIWFVPDLNAKWENDNSRERLLTILHETEREETLMGMSPHFMVVAKK